MTPEEFKEALAQKGIELSPKQLEQFEMYYEFLVATNEHVNLTAITAKDEVYLKHFYDSLLPALEIPDLSQNAWTLCDVGAGAGFPSLPLKIVFPHRGSMETILLSNCFNYELKCLDVISGF